MSRRSSATVAAPDVSVESFEQSRKLESFEDIETVLSAGEVDSVRLFPVNNGAIAWELEQELLHAERLIAATRAARIDPAMGQRDLSILSNLPRKPRTSLWLRIAMWGSLIVGVTLVSCAIALVAMDYYEGRKLSWTEVFLSGPAGTLILIIAGVLKLLIRNRKAAFAAFATGLKALEECPLSAPVAPPHFPVSQRYGSQAPFATVAPANMRNMSDFERLALLLAQTR